MQAYFLREFGKAVCGRSERMTPLFKSILCPVDFSAYSTLAVRYAAALAGEYRAKLIVYHSVPDLAQVSSYLEGNYIQTVTEALLASGREKLEEYSSVLIPGSVASTRMIGSGSAPEAILQLAEKEKVDLIVMGTHGYSGYQKYLMGSVTNRVLHKCAIPVLAVCKPYHHFIHEGAEHPVSIRRILCAVDLEPNSRKVAQMGIALRRAYRSEIHFLYVSKKGDELSTDQTPIHFMRQFIELEQEDWSTVQLHTGMGDPAQEILKAAEHYGTDLVIMGHHTRRPIEEYLLGSVTKRVIPECPCPVLVVRSVDDLVS